MAIDVTFLNNNSSQNITTNLARIETALNDALSLSGNTPNAFSADLDLNGNDIINVGSIGLDGGLSLGDLVAAAEQSVADAAAQVVLASNQVTLASDQVALAAAQVTLAEAEADASNASAVAAALSALQMQTLITTVEAGTLPDDWGLITDVAGVSENYGSIT